MLSLIAALTAVLVSIKSSHSGSSRPISEPPSGPIVKYTLFSLIAAIGWPVEVE